MKTLITIFIILIAFGCGKSESEKLREEESRLFGELYNSLLGTYKNHRQGYPTNVITLTGSREARCIMGGFRPIYDKTPEIMKYNQAWAARAYMFQEPGRGQEVHIGNLPHNPENPSSTSMVFYIEPNGDLTWIASITKGDRDDYSKERQHTFKKLKE